MIATLADGRAYHLHVPSRLGTGRLTARLQRDCRVLAQGWLPRPLSSPADDGDRLIASKK